MLPDSCRDSQPSLASCRFSVTIPCRVIRRKLDGK
jgi:hypothetical protein